MITKKMCIRVSEIELEYRTNNGNIEHDSLCFSRSSVFQSSISRFNSILFLSSQLYRLVDVICITYRIRTKEICP
jgi:hypothetical protein